MGRDNINITKGAPLAEIYLIHENYIIEVEEEFTVEPHSCHVQPQPPLRTSDTHI
jgi:hypothetical protein